MAPTAIRHDGRVKDEIVTILLVDTVDAMIG